VKPKNQELLTMNLKEKLKYHKNEAKKCVDALDRMDVV